MKRILLMVIRNILLAPKTAMNCWILKEEVSKQQPRQNVRLSRLR